MLRGLLISVLVLFSVFNSECRENGTQKEMSDYTELPELIVETRRHKVLHILAYVREYSSLSTYTDTVFMFREKMVDFMYVPDAKSRFNGWRTPRVLNSQSYYRFTDANGLDSVSDVSNYHFSWSDWIGIPEMARLPKPISRVVTGTDTVFGKYSPTEVWIKNDDRVTLSLDILADNKSRKWVPDLSRFFRRGLDFDYFKLQYEFDNVIDTLLTPMALSGYTFNVETRGRGHEMFMFNRYDEPFFVDTRAEVYVVDKEYITVKEAKKWIGRDFNTDLIGMIAPRDIPKLPTEIMALMNRVENIDKEKIRAELLPDPKIGYESDNNNFRFGYRALAMLKQLLGISAIKEHRNTKRQWNDFKRKQNRNRKQNQSKPVED